MAARNRHHYLARFIIDRFVDHEGQLHVYDKRRPESGVQRQSPKDTFVEKHLYSSKKKDGRRDRSLEDRFAELEGATATVVDKIIVAARSGRTPELSDDERNLWDFFLSMRWRRVPEVHSQVMDDATFEKQLAESIAEFEQENRVLTPEERQWAAKPGERPFLRQNVVVASLRSGTDRVLNALHSRGLAVATPDNPKKSFILASKPILRAGPPGETLLHPEIEAWLVIAPDVAVTPYGLRGQDTFRTLTSFGVRKMNEHLARQSNIIASGSPQLIASLPRAPVIVRPGTPRKTYLWRKRQAAGQPDNPCHSIHTCANTRGADLFGTRCPP